MLDGNDLVNYSRTSIYEGYGVELALIIVLDKLAGWFIMVQRNAKYTGIQFFRIMLNSRIKCSTDASREITNSNRFDIVANYCSI